MPHFQKPSKQIGYLSCFIFKGKHKNILEPSKAIDLIFIELSLTFHVLKIGEISPLTINCLAFLEYPSAVLAVTPATYILI